MKSRRSAHRRTVVGLATLSSLSAATGLAQTVATWVGPVGGSWTDASRWSTNPLFPNNDLGGAGSFDVLIGAIGSPYDVVAASSLTVNRITLQSSDATLLISGGQLAANGEIHLAAGLLKLNGGRFATPLITSSGGDLVLTSGTLEGGVLDLNATLDGHIEFRDVTIPAGRVLGTTVSLFESTSLSGEGMLGGGGEVLLKNRDSAYIGVASGFNKSLTLGPEITIRMQSEYNGVGGGSNPSSVLINQGTISIETNSGQFGGNWQNLGTILVSRRSELNLQGNWTNHGLISASDESTLGLHETWTSDGTISVSNGTLEIYSAPAAPGHIQLSGASINLIGQVTTAQMQPFLESGSPVYVSESFPNPYALENSGTELALSVTSNRWTLAGGGISGGTITSLDGTPLYVSETVRSGISSKLRSVHLQAPLVLDSTARIWMSDSTLGIPLDVSKGTLVLSDMEAGQPIHVSGGTLGLENAVVAAPIVLTGGVLTANSLSTNLSTIAVANGVVVLQSPTFSAGGSMSVSDSDLFVGFLEVPANVSRNNTRVYFSGLIDNAGSTLNLGDTPLGPVGLGAGARIQGGRLVSSAGPIEVRMIGLEKPFQAPFQASPPVLEGVTVGSDIVIPTDTYLLGDGGINLDHSTLHVSGFFQAPGAAIAGIGTVMLANGYVGCATIATSVTVRSSGTFQRLYGSDHPALIVGSGSLVNNGRIIVESGELRVTNLVENNGLIEGLGGRLLTFRSRNSLPRMINNGTVIVHGGGTVHIAGNARIPGDDVLRGGAYLVYDGGEFSTGTPVTTLDTVVILDGPGAIFKGLNLANNLGSFTITNGRNYTTPGDLANSGLLVIGSDSTLHVAGALNNTGSIDLAGTLIIDDLGAAVQNALPGTLFDQLVSGYNGGKWDGPGVFSSAAAGDPTFGIGYGDLPAESGGVLLRLALLGDTNLDGVLDQTDLERLAPGFGGPSVWLSGDFNYDLMTTIDDLNLLAANWEAGVDDLNQALAGLGLPPVTVPEPGVAGALLLLGIGRRSRRHLHH